MMNKGENKIGWRITSNPEKLKIPRVILGTSSLGNLYEAIPYSQKLAIVKAGIENGGNIAMFDTAGKYGAGLALETLGNCLKELGIANEQIVISNKLGWLRKPLTTVEPTFEKGVWKELEFDAYQSISYDGMMACFNQGNELLGGYIPQMLSVHDPDEYLLAAKSETDKKKRWFDIIEAYAALFELKKEGKVKAIGVGAKDWQIIKKISEEVPLDWVMFANSMTLYAHPKALMEFIKKLNSEGKTIINSAIFHGGFLTGSDYYNYQLVNRLTHGKLFTWRDHFFSTCKKFNVSPVAACVNYSLNIPGVSSIALNSSSPIKTANHFHIANLETIPAAFWQEMEVLQEIFT